MVSYGLANPALRRVVLCCNMSCCVAACRAAVPGGIGWLMVKSGLEKPKHEGQDIHVSPYRSARTACSKTDCHTFSAALTLPGTWRTVAHACCQRCLPRRIASHSLTIGGAVFASYNKAALSTTAVTLGVPVPFITCAAAAACAAEAG